MTATETQNRLIDRQFGDQAAAYLDSPVHAGGPDLACLTWRIAELQPGVAVDLGAGGGHVSYAMAPHAGRVLACDLSEKMLATVAETAAARGFAHVETHRADVHHLPFADASADFLASRYSAHHWTDLAAALKEARRVLKPGATAIFMDVVSPGAPLLDTHLQAVELLRDPSHVRDYALGEWLSAFAQAAFAIRHVETFRLRLDFAPWVARIGTAPERVAAIRTLQSDVADEVKAYFAIEEDGSFTLDTALIETAAA
ncbi:class I SAM-dependent methyltransferase [Afifella pfennigii]|uniref:class I SAM-dependent methyltransferase n=1 Tax=Afifella pfennigii TaxID=209897 RepID=UPI00047A7157|nr:class I SAM-dependent methyltransferase [Afifella pfennigii]